MANAYKDLLAEFGYTPGQYDDSFTTLTQKANWSSQDEDDCDEDKNSEQARFDRLCVATTWKVKALPQCKQVTDMQRKENDQVVKANLEACDDMYLTPYLQTAGEKSDKSGAFAAAPSPKPSGFRGTQEMQDEAREQLAADQQLQDSLDASQDSSASSMAANTTKQTQSQDKDQQAAAAKPPAFKRRTSSNRVSFGTSPPDKNNVTVSKFQPSPPFFARPDKIKRTGVHGKSYGSRDRSSSAEKENNTASLKETLDDAGSDATMSPPDEIAIHATASMDEAETEGDVVEKPSKISSKSPFRADDKISPIGLRASPKHMEMEQTFVGSQEVENDQGSDHQHGDAEGGNGSREGTSGDGNREQEKKDAGQSGDDGKEGTDDKDQAPDSGGQGDYDDGEDERARRSTTLYQEERSDDDEEEEEEDDLTEPMSASNEESKRQTATEAGLGASYDQTIASIPTLESHSSTKSAISDAANEPAGPKKGNPKPPKKNLFKNVKADETSHEAEDKKDKYSKPAANKKASRRTRSSSKETRRRTTSLGQEDVDVSHPDSDGAIASSQESHDHDAKYPAEADSSSDDFPVGTIVNVEARTWAGINKPGGVGRITKVNNDGTFDVAYVLGGKECHVDETFISKDEEIEEAEKETAPVAARRRRRPQDELPEALLRQLAEQGFDTGFPTGASAARPGKKRKGSGGSALADSTNARKLSADKKKVTKVSGSKATGQKRKETPRSVIDRVDGEQTTTEKKAYEPTATTSQKKENKTKRARKETVDTKPIRGDLSIALSNEEVSKIADALYEQRFRAAFDSNLVTVAASGLSEDDAAALKSLCASTKSQDIKLKLTEAIGKRTTLAVVSADGIGDDMQAHLRTSKVMKCSMEGIPMTTPKWLYECDKAGKIVPPSTFIRTLPTKVNEIEESGDAKYGVARMAALLQDRKNKKALPFYNHFAFVAGTFPSDMRSLVVQLFKDGGGKVLTTPLDVSSKLDAITKSGSAFAKVMVLCGDSGVSIPKSLEQELIVFLESSPSPKIAAVVDYKWVMDSVTCAKAMPVSYFEPTAKQHLWKLSQE
jgi:hypothetical protein